MSERAESIVRTAVLLPAPLHAEIKQLAESEDRTINAQIVRILREWLKQNPIPPKQETEEGE